MTKRCISRTPAQLSKYNNAFCQSDNYSLLRGLAWVVRACWKIWKRKVVSRCNEGHNGTIYLWLWLAGEHCIIGSWRRFGFLWTHWMKQQAFSTGFGRGVAYFTINADTAG
jgi:hypothetical protein